jgi:hypothetical protein
MGEQPRNEPRDFDIKANNIFRQLCILGGEWHDIRTLANNVGAFDNKYMLQVMLQLI